MKLMSKLLMFLILLSATSVYGSIQIDITKGVNFLQPITILPFKYLVNHKISDKIEQIISFDLQISGKFNLIKPVVLSTVSSDTLNISDSKSKTAKFSTVVEGQVKQLDNKQYYIQYQLLKISNKSTNIIMQNNFFIKPQMLRYIAHTISNEIFKKIIGTCGEFTTRIAYIVIKDNQKKNKQYELRIADYDGYNQHTIYASKTPLMSPAWSRDGKKIAFVTFESGNSSLVLQNLTTGKIDQLTSFNKHNGAPSFSPDGKTLVFALSKTGSLNLYLMNMKNKNIQQLTNKRNNNTEPCWMPDNQTIIFTSDQSGKPQIYKINIKTKEQERITWNNNFNQNPNINYNGKFMVMVNTNNGKQNIAKQNLITGYVEHLTYSLSNETPSFSPNGNMIIYNNTSQISNTVLQIISSDGRFKVNLPVTDGQVKFPTWSPYL
uniref:Tol-Pal system protein TolB n=1 Tax=Candidatus Aschnera chinzeii TaxID=1485666 RepID=A0AAT9G4E5_9ENTR|nr:MAG: Tol-Pal system beta propeller repeat protein TolB [Candidatus Aschnera chinzeii]